MLCWPLSSEKQKRRYFEKHKLNVTKTVQDVFFYVPQKKIIHVWNIGNKKGWKNRKTQHFIPVQTNLIAGCMCFFHTESVAKRASNIMLFLQGLYRSVFQTSLGRLFLCVLALHETCWTYYSGCLAKIIPEILIILRFLL